jgi:hypothetical protein
MCHCSYRHLARTIQKNTWNCRKCKMLKHEIVVWMSNGTLLCVACGGLRNLYDWKKWRSSVHSHRECVWAVYTPYLNTRYASDQGDSGSTVVCFNLSWETGHPGRYFAGLLPRIRLQSLLCPIQFIVHWSSYMQHYTLWFMSYGYNCRR